MSRGILLAVGLAVVTGAPASAATICEATWRDEARGRAVPVRIRMPDDAVNVPVILFSHGLGGSLDAGTAWGEAWSRAGFAVIHLQHPGSDSLLRSRADGDGPVAGLRSGMTGAQLVERARDVSFVLDEMARRRSEGTCDLTRLARTRVGMSGHSFGAHTTLAVAGQTFRLPTVDRSLRDTRVTAAVALSPAPPRGADDATLRVAFGKIAIPVMSITGSEDAVAMLNETTPADRQLPYRAMPAGAKYLLVFSGADHAAFSGNIRRARRPSDAHERRHARRNHGVLARSTLERRWRRRLARERQWSPGEARARRHARDEITAK